MINEDDVIKTEKDGIYTLSVKLSDNSGYIDIFSSNIRTFVYVANYYLRNTITTRNVENMDSYIMIVLKIIDSMLQKMIKGIYYHLNDVQLEERKISGKTFDSRDEKIEFNEGYYLYLNLYLGVTFLQSIEAIDNGVGIEATIDNYIDPALVETVKDFYDNFIDSEEFLACLLSMCGKEEKKPYFQA